MGHYQALQNGYGFFFFFFRVVFHKSHILYQPSAQNMYIVQRNIRRTYYATLQTDNNKLARN